MKPFIKDFFSKRDQFCKKRRIWSHLLKKPLMENVIFCAVEAIFLTPLYHFHPFHRYLDISWAILCSKIDNYLDKNKLLEKK